VELYLNSPNTPSWRGAQGEHRDNFTFTVTFFNNNILVLKISRIYTTRLFPLFLDEITNLDRKFPGIR
jgi:hypothetical protein